MVILLLYLNCGHSISKTILAIVALQTIEVIQTIMTIYVIVFILVILVIEAKREPQELCIPLKSPNNKIEVRKMVVPIKGRHWF